MYKYLASPYTHESSIVRELRFRVAERHVAELLRAGFYVYSPIVHCHSLAVKYSLPKDFEFWMAYNAAMLEQASELDVLMLPGWMQSRGVKGEMELAESSNQNIIRTEPENSNELAALEILTLRMPNALHHQGTAC